MPAARRPWRPLLVDQELGLIVIVMAFVSVILLKHLEDIVIVVQHQDKAASERLPCSSLREQLKVLHGTVVTSGRDVITYLARLNAKLAAYNVAADPNAAAKFARLKRVWEELPANPNLMVSTIGACGDTFLVSDYWRGYKPFDSSDYFLQSSQQPPIELCLSFAQVLDHLHSHGVALSASDGDDVDTITKKLLVREEGVRDPRPMLLGPLTVSTDNNSTLSRHDIFLAPQVCHRFLGPEEKVIKNRLKYVHHSCMEKNGLLRPDAASLLRAYRAALQTTLSA